MNKWRGIAGLIIFWACGAVYSAETPAPETKKEPTAETAPTGAEPASPAKAAEKQDVASNKDPLAVIGDQPKYPLKSDLLAAIDDSDSALKDSDNIDRKSGFLQLDLGPLEEVLLALRASSQEYLKANANPNITFKQLMLPSESVKYRGCVVRRTGTLEVLKEMSLSPNLSGLTQVWRGQISNTAGEIVSFQCIEPPAAEIKVGQPVKLIGIYMQRYSYLNRRAGEMLTLSPLLFVRRIDTYEEIKQVTASNSPISNVVSILAFILIGAGIAAWFYMRSRDSVVAGNYFTRLKEEREGRPQGLFPRPARKPEKKKKT